MSRPSVPYLQKTDKRTVLTERKIVSILLADLVGFTSLAEELDPEDIATIQDRYFESVREAIGRYRGRIEKFIGDAAPLTGPPFFC